MKVTAKRRRSKQQVIEDRRREQLEKDSVAQRLQEIADLKAQVNSMQEKANYGEALGGQVQNLVNQGYVKQGEDGNLIGVEDEQERESIQIMTGSKQKPQPE